jgi:hypothetical protein
MKQHKLHFTAWLKDLNDELMTPQNIIHNMTNWVVSSWTCGEDQLVQGEGSRLIQIVEFTLESAT